MRGHIDGITFVDSKVRLRYNSFFPFFFIRQLNGLLAVFFFFCFRATASILFLRAKTHKSSCGIFARSALHRWKSTVH